MRTPWGVLLISVSISAATAQTIVTPVMKPAPTVAHTVINNGPGDQTDPQISGNLVSYTVDESGQVFIRYYDFSSATHHVIPNAGELDYFSDVSAGRIVFSRSSTDTSVFLYDTTTLNPPAEAYPEPNAFRHGPSIGGATIAWLDFTLVSGTHINAIAHSEVAAYDITAGTRTRLTNDLLFDREVDVSPDGSMIVWAKCDTTGTNCDVWKGVKSGSSWNVSQVTATPGEESRPAADGGLIAYASLRSGEQDVYWQSAGGSEYRLDLAGVERNPTIRDGVIVFEHKDSTGHMYDLMAYEVVSNSLYRVTNSSAVNEFVSDAWVRTDGLVRIVYVINDGDSDVHALSFNLNRNVSHDRNTFIAAAGALTTVNFDKTACGAAISPISGSLAAGFYANVGVTFTAGVIWPEGSTAPSPPNIISNTQLNTPTPALIDATFSQPVTAVGMTNHGAEAVLRVFDASNNLIASVKTDTDLATNDFVGLISTTPIHSFEFDFVSGFGFGADDLVFSTISAAVCAPPVMSCPGNMSVNATSPSGEAVTFTVTATDPDGGSVTVTTSPVSGSTFAIGTTTVQATATDSGGQTASCSFTVTVKSAQEQLTDLIGTIGGMGLHQGTVNSLTAKLQNAVAKANAGDTTAACNLLTAFINECNAAVNSNKLAQQKADELIAEAERIQDALGCP